MCGLSAPVSWNNLPALPILPVQARIEARAKRRSWGNVLPDWMAEGQVERQRQRAAEARAQEPTALGSGRGGVRGVWDSFAGSQLSVNKGLAKWGSVADAVSRSHQGQDPYAERPRRPNTRRRGTAAAQQQVAGADEEQGQQQGGWRPRQEGPGGLVTVAWAQGPGMEQQPQQQGGWAGAGSVAGPDYYPQQQGYVAAAAGEAGAYGATWAQQQQAAWQGVPPPQTTTPAPAQGMPGAAPAWQQQQQPAWAGQPLKGQAWAGAAAPQQPPRAPAATTSWADQPAPQQQWQQPYGSYGEQEGSGGQPAVVVEVEGRVVARSVPASSNASAADSSSVQGAASRALGGWSEALPSSEYMDW